MTLLSNPWDFWLHIIEGAWNQWVRSPRLCSQLCHLVAMWPLNHFTFLNLSFPICKWWCGYVWYLKSVPLIYKYAVQPYLPSQLNYLRQFYLSMPVQCLAQCPIPSRHPTNIPWLNGPVQLLNLLSFPSEISTSWFCIGLVFNPVNLRLFFVFTISL